MKKLVFFLLASIVSMNVASAQNERTPTVSFGGPDVVCSDFTISVSILVVSVSTTVYVCCGAPFVQSTPNMPPCAVVSKKTYDMYNGQNRVVPNSGIHVSDLFAGSKADLSKATFVEVTSSSRNAMNGKTVIVKKGKYPIDKNGYVFFETELL